MAYGNFSHTEVIIPYEAKLSEIYETDVWDKFRIPQIVARHTFYYMERLNQDIQ